MYFQSLQAEKDRLAREPRECGQCGNAYIRELTKFYSRGRAIVSCKYGKGCNA